MSKSRPNLRGFRLSDGSSGHCRQGTTDFPNLDPFLFPCETPGPPPSRLALGKSPAGPSVPQFISGPKRNCALSQVSVEAATPQISGIQCPPYLVVQVHEFLSHSPATSANSTVAPKLLRCFGRVSARPNHGAHRPDFAEIVLSLSSRTNVSALVGRLLGSLSTASRLSGVAGGTLSGRLESSFAAAIGQHVYILHHRPLQGRRPHRPLSALSPCHMLSAGP